MLSPFQIISPPVRELDTFEDAVTEQRGCSMISNSAAVNFPLRLMASVA
ncbi:MAG: hypothetical protein ACYC9L_10515 [Sulfuricaulis sp.]